MGQRLQRDNCALRSRRARARGASTRAIPGPTRSAWEGREHAAYSPPILSLALLAFGWSQAAEAQTYNCGNAKAGHCYATNEWQNSESGYVAVRVDIAQAPMSCASDCGGGITNEVWLRDTVSSNCRATWFTECWIEAGYEVAAAGTDPRFFWADAGPDGMFNLHLLDAVDSVGTFDQYMIVKANGLWNIFITKHDGVLPGLSVLTMSPSSILIGQELAGTHNASAGLAVFTRNMWASNAGGWISQSSEGTVASAAPPTGVWLSDPAKPPAGCNPPLVGGEFATSCCL